MDKPQTAQFFSILADGHRVSLMQALAERPHNVSELVQRVGQDQPAVSHSLKMLREAGVVTCEKVGRKVIYTLDKAKLRDGLAVHTAWLKGA